MLDLKIDTIVANGDCGLLIRFFESNHRLVGIHVLAAELLANPLIMSSDTVNVIPAMDHLVLVFTSPVVSTSALLREIRHRITILSDQNLSTTTHEIPVCYEPAVAKDVVAVCEALDLAHERLVEHHSKAAYRVDMLGFLPGFAYLSGNHSRLNLSRKQTPDLQVPAGSVAIANQQTGIYTLSSPGGWHVIGRTPLLLFDWQDTQKPMQLKPLDQVQFKSISLAEFKNLSTVTYQHSSTSLNHD